MPVDTTELRTRARNVAAMELPGTAKALTAAADELDALRTALASVPHGTLCQLLMTRDGEPCSCAKSTAPSTPPATPVVDPLVLIPDEMSVTYLGVTRLHVHGPAGRVLGVLGLTGAHVEQQDSGRTLIVVFEQDTAGK
jgi:hypothetical protein